MPGQMSLTVINGSWCTCQVKEVIAAHVKCGYQLIRGGLGGGGGAGGIHIQHLISRPRLLKFVTTGVISSSAPISDSCVVFVLSMEYYFRSSICLFVRSFSRPNSKVTSLQQNTLFPCFIFIALVLMYSHDLLP